MLLDGHYQNAYVTHDIEQATALIRDQFGVDDVKHYDVELDVSTPHGSGVARMKTAFAWVGDIQYELIEPVAGVVDIYRDALPSHSVLGFHHICMRTQNWELTKNNLQQQGFEVIYEGATEGSRFLFVDCRASLGHYLEYVWMHPQMWSAMRGT